MFDLEMLVRHFLGLYFLFIAIHYASTAMGNAHRVQRTHIHYGDKASATWWIRQTFNVFRAAILLVCLARIFWPIDPYLGIIEALYQPWLLVTGMVVILCSLFIISYTHAYMQNDWRSGVATERNQRLITQGPYARSRNPMFIGILVGQLGFFLALPSIFSLVCLLVGAAMIASQARQEERALMAHFKDRYRAYQRQVPRWL